MKRTTIDWRAAVWAGLAASALFIGLDALLSVIFLTGNMNERLRMVAAIVLGTGVLPPPAVIQPSILLVAVALHMALSVAYSVVIAWLVFRLGFGAAAAVGAAVGLALYLVNFYAFAAVFPWFTAARGTATLALHILFGLVTAIEYKAFARRSRERGASA